ncbi:MAG TPA: PaaI family thioesterase [Dehalococcoidia bacterium]
MVRAGEQQEAGGLLERGRRVLASQPFSVLVGTELLELEPGHAVLVVPLRQELRQQHGFAHGGVLSYLADNALAFAGGSLLGNVLTGEFKINFLRPAAGDALVARARVLHAGTAQAVCQCEVFARGEEGERLCATALGTVVRVPDGRGPAGTR